ncbi:xanthine phosphoribosyltransferase [Anaerobranca californiensis DSM 14826]|jgi:xanthine phosphoribosyltransferase|uniref:Xanthine phosphoribosyltransferase n=1 Tax=Anaerobranca californiensis DSM 14826 TaxID=1120989 RepID=A0A1M6P075_9FIRM|nr:xanthine phosphoribosyltransferase [Anaerobranca californiensis]SHK01389.1 xanthine phosphoribosyltransferase [Anaerobranca californiensis DSM 14826]
MEFLQQQIEKYGKIVSKDIVKVDSFLNHQLKPEIIEKIADGFIEEFSKYNPTKILTIEASGIAIAMVMGIKTGLPVVFAKKKKPITLSEECYTSNIYSYTKKETNSIVVSKEFIQKGDRVIIVDDFLAMGSAVLGLIDIVEQGEGEVVGIGIAVEKGFQQGGKLLREKGYNLKSLAIIEKIEGDKIFFRN